MLRKPKYKGNVIRREIFAGLPAIDKRMKDKTQQERNQYMIDIFNNTREVMAKGIKVPVAEHQVAPGDQELHGELLAIYKKFKRNPIPHYVLYADIFLDEEYFDLYQQGKLPGASVAIDKNGAYLMGITGEETQVGDYIYAVEISGKSPPAQPWLQQLSIDDNYENQPYALFARLVDVERIDKLNDNSEDFKMDPKQLEEMLKKILPGIVEAALAKMFPEGTPEGEELPGPELEAKTEEEKKKKDEEMASEEEEEDFEKNEKIAALEKQIAELKGETVKAEYAKLLGEGKILGGDKQKEKFVNLATEKGLDFVRDLYSTQIVPMGDVVRNTPDKTEDEQKKEQYSVWRKAGIPEHQLEPMWIGIKEKEAERKEKTA